MKKINTFVRSYSHTLTMNDISKPKKIKNNENRIMIVSKLAHKMRSSKRELVKLIEHKIISMNIAILDDSNYLYKNEASSEIYGRGCA